jgi:uncharacterized protein DUF6916
MVPMLLPEEVAVAADTCSDAGIGLTRAQLLERSLVVAVAASLPAFAAAPARAAWGRRAGALSRSAFAPHVGSAFFIERPRGARERVELAEIEDLHGARDSDLAFSLIFRGRRPGAISQGTFPISHRALGTLHLFLVPINTSNAGQDYQVIVDRRPW